MTMMEQWQGVRRERRPRDKAWIRVKPETADAAQAIARGLGVTVDDLISTWIQEVRR